MSVCQEPGPAACVTACGADVTAYQDLPQSGRSRLMRSRHCGSGADELATGPLDSAYEQRREGGAQRSDQDLITISTIGNLSVGHGAGR